MRSYTELAYRELVTDQNLQVEDTRGSDGNQVCAYHSRSFATRSCQSLAQTKVDPANPTPIFGEESMPRCSLNHIDLTICGDHLDSHERVGKMSYCSCDGTPTRPRKADRMLVEQRGLPGNANFVPCHSDMPSPAHIAKPTERTGELDREHVTIRRLHDE